MESGQRGAIYLNHAGTSWPKPSPVADAVIRALGENPAAWPSSFTQRHEAVAAFFGVTDASRLLLTPGCTSALHVGIGDLPWERGDRIVISRFEHHALHRAALALAERGVELEYVPGSSREPFDLDALDRVLARGVRLVAVSWAANVNGALLPISEIVRRAHEHGALVLVDGAQAAGWLPISLEELGADLFAFAGHKGPQAPWGIGGLYVAPHVTMVSPRAFCEVGVPCAPMPGYCDTGSVDRLALAGLVAGLAYLGEHPGRLAEARERIARLAEMVGDLVVEHGPESVHARVPTLAVTVEGHSPAQLAKALRERNVVAAGGSVCAPLAQETLGTHDDGVLRFSVGPATTDADVAQAAAALRAIVEG